MIRSISVCIAAGMAAVYVAPAQDLGERSTINVSGGGIVALGSQSAAIGAAAVLKADYEFRVSKYLSLDAGNSVWFPRGKYVTGNLASVIPGTNLLPYNGLIPTAAVTTSRTTSDAIHATLRGILPVANGRLELFVGAGPGYVWNAGNIYTPRAGAVVDLEAGARVALDNRRRFWLGAGTQLLGNWHRDPQQWLATSVTFGFVFGRKR